MLAKRAAASKEVNLPTLTNLDEWGGVCRTGLFIELPPGFFDEIDVRWYRAIYEQLIPENGITAEIGCYRGRSMMCVADIIKAKSLTVWCIDVFEPFLSDRSTTRLQDFKETAEWYGIREHLKVVKGSSLEAAKFLDDASLDFVFLDGDHEASTVRKELELYEPKVKDSGWIGGHDYAYWPGVTLAVNEYYRDFAVLDYSSIWLRKKGGCHNADVL